FTTRTGDASNIEENNGPTLCQPVGNHGIPVVHTGAEVWKEDERRSAFRAEAPICIADSVGLDKAGRSSDVGVACRKRGLSARRTLCQGNADCRSCGRTPQKSSSGRTHMQFLNCSYLC